MAYGLLPIGNEQTEDANGNPYVGAQLFVYLAGSSTKATSYNDSSGSSANPNPIILNTRGEPSNASDGSRRTIWCTTGSSYKLVLAPSTDTDPPTSPIWTLDNLPVINDTTVTQSQWETGPTPTYVSATSFTVTGDQTSTLHIGRRVKLTTAGGTRYGFITNTAYTTLTTVTVSLDSGSLDSGLSALAYGLLTAVNHAVPDVTLDERVTIAIDAETLAGLSGSKLYLYNNFT
jgi:hypothetical protein